MKCPKCNSDFEQLQTPLGDVERCTECKGLWIDAYEVEAMKPLADVIDSGDEEIGKAFNVIDRIDCPVCPNNQLLRLVDPKQPHIWFESCPTCKGRYYDSGEFKDLATLDLSDFFKKFGLVERVQLMTTLEMDELERNHESDGYRRVKIDLINQETSEVLKVFLYGKPK